MTSHVFLYGSFYSEKLESIVGDIVGMQGAILRNHQVHFRGSHKVFSGSSVATVSPAEGRDVLGIMYELTDRQTDLLDVVMMHCKKRIVEVFDGTNMRAANIYVLRDECGQVRPTIAYQNSHEKLVREAYALYRKQVDDPNRLLPLSP